MIDTLLIPLAAGDAGDAIEILVILAFVVISIVSGLIQKANKAKQEKQEQEAARRRRRERREAREQAQQAKPAQRQPAQPAAGRQRQPKPFLQPVQVQTLEQVKPKPKPPARAKTVRTKATIRRKRAKTAVADRHVGSAHVGKLQHADDKQTADGSLHVNLSSRQAARRAMLYHEIFSPPKALRDDKQMWDE